MYLAQLIEVNLGNYGTIVDEICMIDLATFGRMFHFLTIGLSKNATLFFRKIINSLLNLRAFSPKIALLDV